MIDNSNYMTMRQPNVIVSNSNSNSSIDKVSNTIVSSNVIPR